MKKVFFVAAAALMMCMATSCKEGKCACKGLDANLQPIQEEISQGGYTDDMACTELKAQIEAKYTVAVMECRPGKTADNYND